MKIMNLAAWRFKPAFPTEDRMRTRHWGSVMNFWMAAPRFFVWTFPVTDTKLKPSNVKAYARHESIRESK